MANLARVHISGMSIKIIGKNEIIIIMSASMEKTISQSCSNKDVSKYLQKQFSRIQACSKMPTSSSVSLLLSSSNFSFLTFLIWISVLVSLQRST